MSEIQSISLDINNGGYIYIATEKGEVLLYHVSNLLYNVDKMTCQPKGRLELLPTKFKNETQDYY